jgi:nucleotide-binding universal stress UspA family protein
VSEKEASAVFERILLAANGSPSSRKAAEVAADIGQKYGAEVLDSAQLEEAPVSWGTRLMGYSRG